MGDYFSGGLMEQGLFSSTMNPESRAHMYVGIPTHLCKKTHLYSQLFSSIFRRVDSNTQYGQKGEKPNSSHFAETKNSWRRQQES